MFDVQGRRVRTLVDAYQPAGRHQIPFAGNDLPSGTYMYRLRTAAGERTRQMVLMK